MRTTLRRESHFAWLAMVALTAGLSSLPGRAPAAETALVFPPPPEEPRYVYERTFYSSADVQPAKKKSVLEQLVSGVGGSDARGFSKPYAVAARKGKVYISDSADGVVHVLDVANQKYSRIGEGESDGISKVLGIDVDDAGNLYVADVSAKAVKVFDPAGRLVRDIGDAKIFGSRMASVSVNPEGTRVYVTEIGGVQSAHHRILVFDAQSGKHLFDIGKRGDGPGEFNLPRDVAIGKDGRIYVVDGGNFRIQIFDREGKYLKSFGQVGKYPGQFSRPKEIATDKQGNVYVVDTAFGNFQIFDSEGQLLIFIGNRSDKDGPAKYMLPSGVAVDEDGRVYMVDQWFRKVDVFRPAGLKADEGFLTKKTSAKSGSAPDKGMDAATGAPEKK